MDIRILKYFLTVAREENISRAAAALHVTQPTLSRQIAQLEDELGVVLFDRDTRKLSMTEDGMLLRRRAEEILDLMDQTKRDFTGRHDLIEGKISIGCGELASMEELADLFRDFQALYPKISFDLHTANADIVKERIERGLLDIGLLLEPIDKSKYEFIRMKTQERWVVVMPANDPLAEKEAVTVDDLRNKHLILPRRVNVQSELAHWFGEAFEDLKDPSTSNLSSNASVMVSRGLGYNLCIEGLLTQWNQTRVTYRPLSPELTASSVLAWKRLQPATPSVTRFIEFVRNAAVHQ